MNYEESINYINTKPMFGAKSGLERTKRILELMGNPHEKLKCIHIAGTNGKGSITAMITNVLVKQGYKVGMYTSPYIEYFEERIQINGKCIEKNELAKFVTKIADIAKQIEKEGYDRPTHFEIITCLMFIYFYEKNVDYAVIEVGLGGRLDSTNVITPIISIIASISLDHTNILGDTLDKIAYEKSGIIKEGVPVILYPQKIESLNIIEKVCAKRGSKLIEVPEEPVYYEEKIIKNEYYQMLKVKTFKSEYEIKLSLLGKHQLLNCVTALYAIETLKDLGIFISQASVKQGFSTVKWKGRLEILNEHPIVVVDGAHNIDGITKIAESINTYFKYKKLNLIIGILADKQVDDMIKIIAPMANNIISVTPNSTRAENCEKLNEIIRKYNKNCTAEKNYEDAYKKALSYCDEDDLLLVCGSLYMIGDMRKIINKHIK